MGDQPVVTWPWVLAAVLVAATAAVGWALLTRNRRLGAARWVANTDHLDEVPEIRRAIRIHGVLRVVAAATLTLGLVSAAVLAARPADVEVRMDTFGTRDIVLCLDVSGSMAPFDSEIVDLFAELVDGFSGERIALSVFNSTSRTVFPLTDDYTLALEELEVARRALEFDLEALDPLNPLTWEGMDELLAFIAGTEGVPGEASLIGDGLAGCALLFDEQATDRSRSIILATDNDPWGTPIYTLPQAVDLVASRDVTLYGLYGGEEELRGSERNVEFTDAIDAADGRSWFAEDPAAVATILDDVVADQAIALGAEPERLYTDRPMPWFALLVLGILALLVLRWRVRE